MNKCLSLILSVLLLMTTFAGALSGMTLTASAAEDDGISGVREIQFARNGTGGSPYMSGLNSPVGYVFTLDPEDKWIICHEQNEALLARGVVPGITGINYKVAY